MSSSLHQKNDHDDHEPEKGTQELAAREIFVVVDLEAKRPGCSYNDCKANGREFI